MKEKSPKKQETPKKIEFECEECFPTQVLMVGKIKCFFASWFNHGRTPLLSIGPSWPFTIGLIAFAIGATTYFLVLLSIYNTINAYLKLIFYFEIVLNLGMLFAGILKNPGIPDEYVLRVLQKNQ